MKNYLTTYQNSIKWGLAAALVLLLVYFIITLAVSGLNFVLSQFEKYWYFIISLALGFGIQVGLYTNLRQRARVSPGVVGANGITSTATMVSCCTHYLINVLPVLGAVGIITFISQYQIQLFWVGIIFNILGIAYLLGLNYKMR